MTTYKEHNDPGPIRRTVTGRYERADGRPAAGTLVFTPSTWLVNKLACAVLLPVSIRATLNAHGVLLVDLLRTDHPGIAPTEPNRHAWFWQVEEQLDGFRTAFALQIPAGEGPLDLATCPESFALLGGVPGA